MVNLTIEAMDKGGLVTETILEINIKNVNKPPYFVSIPNIMVAETADPGSCIHTVSAHDEDSDDSLSYIVNFQTTEAASVFLYNSTSKCIVYGSYPCIVSNNTT